MPWWFDTREQKRCSRGAGVFREWSEVTSKNCWQVLKSQAVLSPINEATAPKTCHSETNTFIFIYF